jgi:hypothetical protein
MIHVVKLTPVAPHDLSKYIPRGKMKDQFGRSSSKHVRSNRALARRIGDTASDAAPALPVN